MSNHSGNATSTSTSAVRNTTWNGKTLRDQGGLAPDAASREQDYQLLPNTAEKAHQKKVPQEKLKGTQIQKGKEDSEANVKGLKLAGIWDIIVEMLKWYELPDKFESNEDWTKLGTKFRKLVKLLDIANYKRRSKDDDTGSYLREGGRPKRYKIII
ncbi:protein EDS1L [Artemisia annua]|uniref:Protein EDS1L n=1 Tax=Artemisia annua TaxID=35608 RepID=A0A2U1NZ03_ARTAN|nr:protein EDS1L [Artemisia annua]